jgi:hypothetical protein
MDKFELGSVDTINEVYQITDRFKRDEMLERMRERARELGKGAIGYLNKMIASYQDEFNVKEERRYPLNYTHFAGGKFDTGEWENKACGEWIATDDAGIYRMSEKGMKVIACLHPIIPLILIKNIETQKAKVKLAFRRRGVWEEIIVEKSVLASASKIVSLSDYNVGVTSENAKNLVQYLNDIDCISEFNIPLVRSTSKFGWREKYFIPYDSELLFDNENGFKQLYDAINTPVGDREVWYDLVRKIRVGQRFEPKIYIATAFASILLERLNALPFILNLWGSTGKGKTVALMLATSIYANPSLNLYMADAKSTNVALEVKLNCLNNLPLMIDDLAQIVESQVGKGKDFSEFIYYLCSGGGKSRSNKDLGIREAGTWCCAILTNSERPLTSEGMQGGASNRVIDIEMDEGEMFESGKGVVEVIRKNYGFAGRDFVDLLRNYTDEQLNGMYKEYKNRIEKQLRLIGEEKEEKQIIPIAIILLADKLVTDNLFKDGQYLDFNKVISCVKSKEEVDENAEAYKKLKSFPFVYGQYIDFGTFANSDKTYSQTLWGKQAIESQIKKLYIVTSQFDILCKDVLKVSKKAFFSWLDRRGLIEKNESSRKATGITKFRIGGSLNGQKGDFYIFSLVEDSELEKPLEENNKSGDEELPY